MNNYIFLLEKDLTYVKSYAEQNGLKTRIVNRDNVPVLLTCEYDGSRLNLTVIDGIVKEIDIG
jgi:hypothetical protein